MLVEQPQKKEGSFDESESGWLVDGRQLASFWFNLQSQIPSCKIFN